MTYHNTPSMTEVLLKSRNYYARKRTRKERNEVVAQWIIRLCAFGSGVGFTLIMQGLSK